MRRRSLLAALGTTLLAGCSSEPDGSRPPGFRDTTAPTYTGTTLSEPKPVPEPPEDVTPASVEQFVRDYERAVVYNDLLPGHAGEEGRGVEISSGGCVGAKSISVEEPATRVLLDDGPGVYVAAAVSGHVEYACPGSSSASGSRNRSFVAHYVGPERHVAVPYNFYQCAGRETPYASPRDDENAVLDTDGDGYRESAPVKVQLYDFHRDTHAVETELTHVESGDRVLAETYTTDQSLTVVANLAVRVGTYRLVARLADGAELAHEFDASGPSAPAWNGTCIVLTPQAKLRAVTVDSTPELGIRGSLCHESLAGATTTAAGSSQS